MLISHIGEITDIEVAVQGSKGTVLQWLLADKAGHKSFSLKNLSVHPGRSCTVGSAARFFELYVTHGRGTAHMVTGDIPLRAGSIVYTFEHEIMSISNSGVITLELIIFLDQSVN